MSSVSHKTRSKETTLKTLCRWSSNISDSKRNGNGMRICEGVSFGSGQDQQSTLMRTVMHLRGFHDRRVIS